MFKKVTAIVLSLAAVLTIGSTAAMAVENSAGENVAFECGAVYDDPTYAYPRGITSEDLSTEDMTLIEETETFEEGLRIVDRTYAQEGISTYSDSALSAPQIVKRERAIYDTGSTYGTLLLTIYAIGIFTYNGKTAYVTDPGRYYVVTEAGRGTYIREKSFCYGSDQGSNILFGHKYAYVEYVITANINGKEKDLRLWIDVNCKGTISVDI